MDKDESKIIRFNDILGINLVVNGNKEDGYTKALVFDFKSDEGDIFSVAYPNVLVKQHAKKEDSDGESGDRSSGVAKEQAEEDNS